MEARKDIEKVYGKDLANDEDMIRRVMEEKRKKARVDSTKIRNKVEYKQTADEQDENEIILL